MEFIYIENSKINEKNRVNKSIFEQENLIQFKDIDRKNKKIPEPYTIIESYERNFNNTYDTYHKCYLLNIIY